MGEITIWKFPLEITDTQVVKLPIENQILSVGEDPGFPKVREGKLALWAIVGKPEQEDWIRDARYHREVKIRVFGTGNPFPPSGDMSHLATVVLGPGVWHVFRDHEGDPPEIVMAAGVGHHLGGPPMERTV